MGGLCTKCRPQVPKDKNSTIKHHGSFLRRKKTVSAAFSFATGSPAAEKDVMIPDGENLSKSKSALLDINQATEEDLMTLTNVGRVIAHNIVEYRKKIGGFRRVEDLALVSGIGAVKLEKLRKDIFVSSSRSKTNSSSTSISDITLPLNVNVSSVQQLSQVDGVSEELAKAIVEYRTENGKFHHITDLVDPAQLIDTPTLLKLKYVLTVNNLGHSRNVSNCSSRAVNIYPYGPESIPSSRPKFETVSDIRDGRPMVRIATWNLQQFSLDKVKNPGVREVICMTILENNIKILAVQELAHPDALSQIVNELNNPTLPNIQRIRSRSGLWKCSVSATAAGKMYQGMEYSGFLWNEGSEITLYSSSLLDKSEDGKKFARQPFLGYFKINQFDVVLVSVHLKAIGYADAEKDLNKLGSEISCLPLLVEVLKSQVPEEKDVIIVGDFNLEPDKTEFEVLRQNNFSAIVPETTPTNISTKNVKGSRSYDNMWINQSVCTSFTSHWDVVRNGLTSPWIPDGWSWGGVVSDHCPVWSEFFTDIDADPESSNANLEGITLSIG
uniref:Endonuclease/exonuclease/phosphatase family domain-containing protein 1 n=1 Tax=Phallusia mammillata TaxID=59560 RepID=A0A6F9DCA2_9ASCI|nr:endonuclease/exonuclease/phosphatase family domain-containing protein 1-like [Phallusia mammillata]